MSDFVSRIDPIGAAKALPRGGHRPRILITGACRGVGHSCAEALGARGAELLLCDKDGARLREVAATLGAAAQFVCDVAAESSVAAFADNVLDRYASLDMVINAAGGGYARTLGMYRVSRALMPALHRGARKLLVNVPPAPRDAEIPTFPYASSRLAFHRLSAALALEARGTSISVLVACPAKRRVMQVLPDPNAGTWAEACDLRQPSREDILTLAWQVASLLDGSAASRRHAG